MVSVGGQLTSAPGVVGSLTLNGNLYVGTRSFSSKWGNNLDEEGVVGTDIPIVIMEKFHGEFSMEIVYSTENTGANEQFGKLMVPSNGGITAISMVWTGKDTSGTVRTFTLTSVVWPKETEWGIVGDKLTTAKITCIFTARPTVT